MLVDWVMETSTMVFYHLAASGDCAEQHTSDGCVQEVPQDFLLVQDDGQKRLVDLDPAVVFDEAQLPELVHE